MTTTHLKISPSEAIQSHSYMIFPGYIPRKSHLFGHEFPHFPRLPPGRDLPLTPAKRATGALCVGPLGVHELRHDAAGGRQPFRHLGYAEDQHVDVPCADLTLMTCACLDRKKGTGKDVDIDVDDLHY